ncbi:hypothetical protein KAR28_06640 [Candidatus Parcubacteria bacterium]|nr:hypothetical protein [Candidatus Parcubacteria bacterium]
MSGTGDEPCANPDSESSEIVLKFFQKLIMNCIRLLLWLRISRRIKNMLRELLNSKEENIRN